VIQQEGNQYLHLKTYKELSGGGSMMIVNKTVSLALESLGYEQENISNIVKIYR